MSWAFAETATIHTYGSTAPDEDGNAVPTFTDHVLDDVAIFPLDASEIADRGTTSRDYRRMVRLGPMNITSRDEVTVEGKRWKVDGEPQPYRSVLTGTPVTSVVLERVTG